MMFKLGLVFTFALISCTADAGYPSVRPNEQLPYDQGYSYEDPRDQLSGDDISGVAGMDYPIFREVPQTRFECEQQQYPGYYADPEAECQAFHICQRSGRQDSFLCPNGTLFNQARLICEWWYNVDCSRAQSFYSINEAVAKAMEEADRRTRLAAEEKLSQSYLHKSNDAGHWDQYNQQNAKQGWNNTPARHNVMSDFAKDLSYEAPATSSRPVYGSPEFSTKSNVDNQQWNQYNQQNAKQGWNNTPARHNVMSDFAKDLPYEAPATSSRPVYGSPEFSIKSNVDNQHWNQYQQNAKQGWNNTPARHNVMSDFAKDLPYEAPATSSRPVYGSPEFSTKSNVDNQQWNQYNQQNAKQGWNNTPARHNVMSDFAKDLPYKAPATSSRPVYGSPEFSIKSNVDNQHWNQYNQQNAKQGWNNTPARHNVMSDFAKDLPYEAPATSSRPVYGSPEFSTKSNVDNQQWNQYNQQNAKQGWNNTPARHNVMSDFAKDLPYEAPATSSRPVYGSPEFSTKSNVDNQHWNQYNQQNAKQGWNNTPARHNVMSDFAKDLRYEAPATSSRPLYSAPEISANSLPNANNRGDSYSQQQDYTITDAKFGEQTKKSNFAEPASVYLPASFAQG